MKNTRDLVEKWAKDLESQEESTNFNKCEKNTSSFIQLKNQNT